MSLLTTISKIPLYSTKQEALDWAKDNGKQGLHTHMYRGQTGFMGGVNHRDVVDTPAIVTPPTPIPVPIPIPIPVPIVIPRRTTRVARTTAAPRSSGYSGGGSSSSGSSGSSGGGGGY